MNSRVPMKSIMVEAQESQVSPLQALKHLAPSAFTLESAPAVSEKYRHITTSDVVQHLMLNGWQLDKAGETRITRSRREKGLAPYVAHSISLRHPDYKLGKLKAGDIVPNMILGGSHDRSTAFWMNGGLYRCICDNQAIVSMGTSYAARFRHQGIFAVLMENVYRAVDEMLNRSNMLTEAVQKWQSVTLNDSQRREYFTRIINLRPESKGKTLAIENVDAFDYRRRAEDMSNDLFTVFQVVQEHTMRGLRLPVVVNGRTQERSLSRGISGVNNFIETNKTLWELTEAYATELTNA